MNKMYILNHQGDETIEWNTNDPESILIACQRFIELRKQGYLIYKVVDGDRLEGFDPNLGSMFVKNGEQIHEFQPEIKEIVAAPALQGG